LSSFATPGCKYCNVILHDAGEEILLSAELSNKTFDFKRHSFAKGKSVLTAQTDADFVPYDTPEFYLPVRSAQGSLCLRGIFPEVLFS